MADPDAEWVIEVDDTPAEEVPPPAEGEAPPPEEGATATEEAPKVEEEELPWPRPPKEIPEPIKLEFRHWIRPTFLNYHYIYDFRHNYYDDVIDYMDRRLRGINRDIPVAQTWAERALRTYTCKETPGRVYFFPSKKEWGGTLKVAKTWRSQHTTNYFRRKFASILL
uniref:Flightin n=1 Tax=Clastoptera arizonana TaxID=38151 RepID=A0A1B6CB28_9HEMI